MPIQLASYIIPKNDNTWFLVEDIYMKGGFQVQASHAGRDALPVENRKAGMHVYVLADQAAWVLGSDLLTWTLSQVGATGPVGPQGQAGPQGPTGAQGPTGPVGGVGPAGPSGPAGPAGPAGPVGPTGPTGPQGQAGFSAYQQAVIAGFVGNNSLWLDGLKGAKGDRGDAGAPLGVNVVGLEAERTVYDNAAAGFIFLASDTNLLYIKLTAVAADWSVPLAFGTGAQGPQGLKGDPGAQGAQGPQGNTGLPGPQGLKGNTGDNGVAGPTGPEGPMGQTGPQGLKGNTGDNGVAGPTGPTGPTGAQGPIGATGIQGSAGFSAYQLAVIAGFVGNTALWLDGLKGTKGDIGPIGLTGPVGPTGTTGLTGGQGPTGLTGGQGNTGPIGPVGPTGLPGVDGSTMRSGVGTPSTLLGLNGDYYIDIGNQNLYTKSSGAYVLLFNIRGLTGAQGVNGATWRTGAGTPAAVLTPINQLGVQGDFYLDSITQFVWHSTATGSYTQLLTMKGDKGDTGAVGPTGPTGAAGATTAHAAMHAVGGSDAVSPASIGALPVAGGTITGDLMINGTTRLTNNYADPSALPSASGCPATPVFVESTSKLMISNGTDWVEMAKSQLIAMPYDIAFFLQGTMTAASELVAAFTATRKISIYAGATGSLAKAVIAPVAPVTYGLKIGATSVGSVSFAAGATTGNVAYTNSRNFQAGETMYLYNPASIDAVIKDVTISIVGYAEAPQSVMLP